MGKNVKIKVELKFFRRGKLGNCGENVKDGDMVVLGDCEKRK